MVAGGQFRKHEPSKINTAAHSTGSLHNQQHRLLFSCGK
jgi:hypothetical protein